jgi:hypothetical protein
MTRPALWNLRLMIATAAYTHESAVATLKEAIVVE